MKRIIVILLIAIPLAAYLVFNERFGLAGTLACSKMAPVNEIEAAIKVHQDTIEKIKKVRGDNAIEVTFENPYGRICPGKGRILIMYPSKPDKAAIQKLIGSDTFFGIQYAWRNI